MKKEEYIREYGRAGYEKKLQQDRERLNEHPERIIANARATGRKGGKYYEYHRQYQTTGLQGKRNLVRVKHRRYYRPYKQIIAPDSQLHHQWVPGASEYMGVALVEKDQHMHGFIDVIQILEGKITLLTEAEIRGDK